MIKIKLFILVLLVFLISLFCFRSVNASSSYLTENSTWQQNLTAVSWSSTSFGDIDNDGDLDLVLTGSGSNIAKIYENNGTSFRENKTWQQNLTGVNRGSTVLGDIDNDGDLDLVLTGCNSGGGQGVCNNRNSKIYENNGTSFRENKTWQQNLTAIYWGAVAFGDVDNDGDLDLVLTGGATTGRLSKVYINNGTSLVENKKWYSNITAVYESGMVLGDIDNDKDLDLVLSGDSSTGGISKVYLNNGTSLIESSTWQQNLFVVEQSSIVYGDIDNDGDLDLSIIGISDSHRIYNNTGLTFKEIQSDAQVGGVLAPIFDGSQAFGDYDNDGDLDLITTGFEGYTTIYLGYGNGTFSSYSNDPEPYIVNLQYGPSLVWSDINNDTKLDLLITGAEGTTRRSKVYTNNNTIQNTKPTPPKQFTNYTTDAGNIHLGWGNGSDAQTLSNGLYYNLRVGSTSGGNQIISGKYGGGEDNGYFGNMMQRRNITLKSTRLLPNTQYFWSVQVIDTALKASSWSAEKDFTTLGDLTPPVIILNAPINHYNSSSFRVLFNTTVYDNRNVTNVTLYGNWTGNWIANFTNSSSMNNSVYLFDIKLNQEGDDYYKWAIRACDNSSLCRWGDNRTFLVDTHYPNVSLIRPLNNSILTSSGVSFSYNVTDKAISNCSLIIGSVDQTDYSVTPNTEQSFSKSFSDGSYRWNVNCTDTTNHTNMSKIRSFTISIPSGGGISSGAGKRAYTKPVEKPVVKKEEKPIERIIIKPEHLEEIKTYEEKPKSRIVSFFETIYAFITSLLIILSYIWIIKEDFPKNED